MIGKKLNKRSPPQLIFFFLWVLEKEFAFMDEMWCSHTYSHHGMFMNTLLQYKIISPALCTFLKFQHKKREKNLAIGLFQIAKYGWQVFRVVEKYMTDNSILHKEKETKGTPTAYYQQCIYNLMDKLACISLSWCHFSLRRQWFALSSRNYH